MLIDTGYVSPLTIVSNGNYTGNPWLNPNNLLTLNGQYASTPSTSTLGSDVVVGNFVFLSAIPQGSVIAGIEVSFTGYRGVTASPATALQIYAYDNTNGNNFFYQLTPVFSGFTTLPVTYYFGSPSYLFNTTWSVDQINNLKIRLQGNGELFIDGLQIRVTYQPAFSGPIVTQGICASIFQAQPFRFIAPVSANISDVNWLVDRFETSDGVPITNADIGPIGIPVTADQGNENEENAYVIGITPTVGSQVILNVTRGWSFRDPNSQGAPLRQHGTGHELIISNSIQFYDIFVRKCMVDVVFAPPISVYDEGNLLTSSVHSFNFVGPGVTATAAGPDVTVTIPGFGITPPALGGSGSGTSGGVQVTTITDAGVFTLGTDRWLVIGITLESTQTLTTVTFDGNLMTFLGAQNQGAVRVELWGQIAPSLGTHPLIINTFGLTYLAWEWAFFNQVDQVTPFVFSGGNGALTNTSTGSVLTTQSSSTVLHVAGTKLVGIAYTAGGGESLIETSLTGAVQGGMQLQPVGTPALVTSDIFFSSATDWANLLGEILGLQPAIPPIVDHFVAVSAADTTPDYLQPKLNIHSSNATITVTPSITNPGGNEILDYDLVVAPTAGNNLLIDQTPDNGTYGLLAGAVNGINTTYTVSAGLYVSGSLAVYLNGLIQFQGAADDWQETAPAAGTFDFNVAPLGGDIITVTYQTVGGGFGAQTGIQFEDEGVNLGTPGTVNELDFVGTDITATRVGDKVTVTLSSSGSSTFTVNADENEASYIVAPIIPKTATYAGQPLVWDVAKIYPNGFIMGIPAAATTRTNFFDDILDPNTAGGQLLFTNTKEIRIKLDGWFVDPGGGIRNFAFGLGDNNTLPFTDYDDTTLNSIKLVFYAPGAINTSLEVWAVCSDAAARTKVNITPVSNTIGHIYELVWKPATTEVEFWVDGALATSINTTVPVAVANAFLTSQSVNTFGFAPGLRVITPTIAFER